MKQYTSWCIYLRGVLDKIKLLLWMKQLDIFELVCECKRCTCVGNDGTVKTCFRWIYWHIESICTNFYRIYITSHLITSHKSHNHTCTLHKLRCYFCIRRIGNEFVSRAHHHSSSIHSRTNCIINWYVSWHDLDQFEDAKSEGEVRWDELG